MSEDDIKNDKSWLNTTVVTTNNNDRHQFNKVLIEKFCQRNNQIVIKWKKKIIGDIPESIKNIIYDENVYHDLFGYFAIGAKVIITKNTSGNVMEPICVCNGTKCIMHSIRWIYKYNEKRIQKITNQ